MRTFLMTTGVVATLAIAGMVPRVSPTLAADGEAQTKANSTKKKSDSSCPSMCKHSPGSARKCKRGKTWCL